MGLFEERETAKQLKEAKLVKNIKRGAFTVGGLIVAMIVWFNITETVSQGHVGVVFNKANGGVQQETLPEGLHVVSPLSRITEYPTSTETIKYSLSLPTADTKTITFPITYDYNNDPSKVTDIYRQWRGQKPEALEKGFLRTKMIGIASDITSKYTILELNNSRSKIQTEILKEFTKTVGAKGFVVTSVTLGTPEYDEQTKIAIQQVVDKQQELEGLKIEKEKAQIEAERQKIEADGQAQAKIAEAKGTAESVEIEAKAQSKANKMIQSTLTKEVLENNKITKWNGVNSTHILGGTGVNINTK